MSKTETETSEDTRCAVDVPQEILAKIDAAGAAALRKRATQILFILREWASKQPSAAKAKL